MEADNASTDATLTETLPAADNTDPSIDGAARIDYVNVSGTWQTDDGEGVDSVDEYSVECSCGKRFCNWGAATRHAEEQH